MKESALTKNVVYRLQNELIMKSLPLRCASKAVYILYSCLTIFVLLYSLSPLAQVPSYGESVRQRTASILDLRRVYHLDELTEGKAEIFSIPNRLHTKGMLHSEIYRSLRKGQATLIKTIFPDSVGYIGDRSFQKEVFAMVLASGIGGPQIFKAGKIKNVKGEVGYFIQMEEMFSGERDTFTFKGWGSRTLLRRWQSMRSPSPAQLEKIGHMINFALERGIAIGLDNDFIFSHQSDDVRWLDTAQWELAGGFSADQPIYEVLDFSRSNFNSEMALNNYGYLIKLFFLLKKNYGMSVLESLLSSVQQSEVWSDLQKKHLVENLRITMVKNLGIQPAFFKEANRASRLANSNKSRCEDLVSTL